MASPEYEQYPKIKETNSNDAEFEKELYITIGTSQQNFSYRFLYRIRGNIALLYGRSGGGSSSITLDDEDFSALQAQKGRDALNIVSEHIQKNYPDVQEIDLKPEVLRIGRLYTAWNTRGETIKLIDENSDPDRLKVIISEAEYEKLKKFIGREIQVETRSTSIEFSTGQALLASHYLGFKGDKPATLQDFENANGIFSSFGSTGRHPAAVLKEVELSRIKVERSWSEDGEWIPFMSESRFDSHVHLSGGDCYQAEIISKIEVGDDLIFEKSIEEVEEFFPDDVKEKLKSYIGISIPGPE